MTKPEKHRKFFLQSYTNEEKDYRTFLFKKNSETELKNTAAH
jgi:hypothetical protein